MRYMLFVALVTICAVASGLELKTIFEFIFTHPKECKFFFEKFFSRKDKRIKYIIQTSYIREIQMKLSADKQKHKLSSQYSKNCLKMRFSKFRLSNYP